MSILRALSLVLAGAIAGAGQVPNPAPQKAKPSDLCSVEGVVVKSTTGEGIKRVSVQLTPLGAHNPPYATLTETNGYFAIRDIAPGRYVIIASGNGYRQQASGKVTQVRSLDLVPGKNVRGIALRLVPPGVITGTVYDEDGDPVTLAQVKALRVTGSGAHRQMGDAGSAQTNDLGQYRIWGLEPGQYLVVAAYQRPRDDPGQQSDEVYLPTFHPSTQDTSQAAIVEVQPGAEVSGIDVDLGQAHAVVVRGRVMVDNPAKSLRGIQVKLTPRATVEGEYPFSDYGSIVQNESGNFEIRNVPPGSYSLSASGSDGTQRLYARLPVEVSGANLEGVTIILGNPTELAGRFRVEGSGPFNFTRLGVWLQAIDGTMGSGNAEVKPDGTFVVQSVYDGNYRVRVFGYPEEYYVKSVRQGGSDALESGLTVSRSQSATRLEIVLSPDGGCVDGTVMKEQNPVSGAWLVLVPDPPHRDREEMYTTATTGTNGHFSMVGLSPGDYKLFAWELVQGKNYRDPDFFGAFENRATPVHTQEKQQQTVQLDVITSDEQLR